MIDSETQSHTSEISSFLYSLIAKTVTPAGLDWVNQSLTKLQGNEWEKNIPRVFSMAPRFVGKSNVLFTPLEKELANKLKFGWQPFDWSIDRITRIFFLLNIPQTDSAKYKKTIESLFSVADVGELVALYSSLPLLPYPAEFQDRTAEGIRTNMVVVFDSIVLQNPYPAEFLSESAWNQMVLKSVFIGRPLYKIWQLDKRANVHLALMLSDFAHERWAAGRTVTPEVWRLVTPFILEHEERFITDLTKVLNISDTLQQQAGLLALDGCPIPSGLALITSKQELRQSLVANPVTWETVADQWYARI